LTATTEPSAIERAAKLDLAIEAAVAELDTHRDAAPQLSAADHAAFALGELATKPARPADISAHKERDDQMRLTLNGLVARRIEEEQKALPERMAEVDAKIAALRGSSSPRSEKLIELQRKLAEIEPESDVVAMLRPQVEQLERVAESDLYALQLLLKERHTLDVAVRSVQRGVTSDYWEELFDKYGISRAVAARDKILGQLSDPHLYTLYHGHGFAG